MERDVLSRESGGGARWPPRKQQHSNGLEQCVSREVRERPSFPLGLVHTHGRGEEGRRGMKHSPLWLSP